MDKVWPVDKTSGSPIKNSEKLGQLNYEEKLQKACIKLGARFVEYRPETGSWVFKVEHFSKVRNTATSIYRLHILGTSLVLL